MKRILNSAIFACAVAIFPVAFAAEPDCYKTSEAVTKAVTAKPDNVLAIVEREIAASPACSCEIVKAAIVATEADGGLVGQIVSAAIGAAPEQLEVIAKCAIAVAPDALSNIQAAVAKLNLRGAKSGLDSDKEVAKSGADPVNTGSAVRDPLDEHYLIPGLPPIHPVLDALTSTCTPDEFPNIDILHSSSSSNSDPEGSETPEEESTP